MKSNKIGDYLSAIIYLFIAVFILNSDIPDKFFGAFVIFLAAVQSIVHSFESDYCQRLSRRLTQIGLFLTLFWIVKIWLSL